MRALIVLAGDAPGTELLRSCAGCSDLTIAADKGLEAFHAAGVEPDLLVGDMDSIAPAVLEAYASRIAQERLNCEKDDTDGEHALNTAIARGADQITILGALGGRMDHAMSNLMLLVRAGRRGVRAEILTEQMRIVRVCGETVVRGAKGDTFSLIPLGEARGVTISGCYYHSAEELTFPCDTSLGVSNVFTQDEARITVKEGDLLLFHLYNA